MTRHAKTSDQVRVGDLLKVRELPEGMFFEVEEKAHWTTGQLAFTGRLVLLTCSCGEPMDVREWPKESAVARTLLQATNRRCEHGA